MSAVDACMDSVKRIPRPLRPVCVVLGGWLGLFLAVNLVIMATGLVARWSGKDPRLDDDRWPGVRHLRRVDDKLLVGGETSPEEYRELADRGVTLVIDARTGSATDATIDDPDELAELGMDYARLAVPDGRAPTQAQIRRFLDLVEEADGLVFAHCGGGVGRASSLAAVVPGAAGGRPAHPRADLVRRHAAARPSRAPHQPRHRGHEPRHRRPPHALRVGHVPALNDGAPGGGSRVHPGGRSAPNSPVETNVE
jgi:protein tyrosine phosphatase (PTP) superfamily phosphohydrolase (DUF442 family)